jgi:TfoX N-terminal domain
MAYDEADVERVRHLMTGRSDVVEQGIVGGGRGFMVGGHLCCGVSMRGLTVRVGAAAVDEALTHAHVRRLEFGGRPTAAFIVVEPAGYRDDDDLARWVDQGLRFVDTLG